MASRTATSSKITCRMLRLTKVQLQQVLVNVIMNAIEAMSEIGGRERMLTISSTVDEREVTLTIADNGQGLDPGCRHRIFDSFFTTKSNGMGLGLSICRSIIEGLGGRIWASPNDPCGAA